jgi:hypothetical protein
MQACPIRRGPSSSSLSADPQGGRQAPLTILQGCQERAHSPRDGTDRDRPCGPEAHEP